MDKVGNKSLLKLCTPSTFRIFYSSIKMSSCLLSLIPDLKYFLSTFLRVKKYHFNVMRNLFNVKCILEALFNKNGLLIVRISHGKGVFNVCGLTKTIYYLFYSLNVRSYWSELLPNDRLSCLRRFVDLALNLQIFSVWKSLPT